MFLKQHRYKALVSLALLALTLLTTVGQSPDDFQNFRQRRRNEGLPNDQTGASFGEYTFVRTIYDSPARAYGYGYYGRRGGTWSTDYPNADNNFIVGLREWAGTNLKIAPRPEQIPIMDDRIFDYPIIYFVEPGFLELSDEQAARLREYVARGGFMFFDDFWGVYEWENLETQLKKIWPEGGYTPKDLPLSHPIFHSYLDVEEVVQVPNIYNAQRGVTSEKGGIVPHYMGVEDPHSRIVTFISFNCDLGDAWEWINDPSYPVKYGLPAYKLGINVVIYAMSH
ncbi:MAG: transmembrane prediction [Blastocatellia bacterium]|nr:MAG: transmembrane prediction [Blastocatellia bacterium]